MGILEDEEGNLWLSTRGGLSRFTPQTGAFRTFSGRGLQSTVFNDGAYYKGGDGEMFFGGLEGLYAFYPNQLELRSVAPPVSRPRSARGTE